MFVAYLNQLNSAKFKDFLLAIQDGMSFATAFQNAYRADIGDIWLGFLAEMKKPNNAFNTNSQKRRLMRGDGLL